MEAMTPVSSWNKCQIDTELSIILIYKTGDLKILICSKCQLIHISSACGMQSTQDLIRGGEALRPQSLKLSVVN